MWLIALLPLAFANPPGPAPSPAPVRPPAQHIDAPAPAPWAPRDVRGRDNHRAQAPVPGRPHAAPQPPPPARPAARPPARGRGLEIRIQTGRR